MQVMIDVASNISDFIAKITGVVLPWQLVMLLAVCVAVIGVYLIYEGIKAKMTAIIIVGVCMVCPAAWSVVKSMLTYVFHFIKINTGLF